MIETWNMVDILSYLRRLFPVLVFQNPSASTTTTFFQLSDNLQSFFEVGCGLSCSAISIEMINQVLGIAASSMDFDVVLYHGHEFLATRHEV